MEFVYETDSFASEGFSKSDGLTPSFKMPNIQNLPAFQSFQASDLSKRLTNLSILNINKKEADIETENEAYGHQLSIQRAEKSLQLLESLGLNTDNTFSSSSSSTMTNNLNGDDIFGGFYSENEIMKKLALITENSSGYDSSLRNSLEILETRMINELETAKLNDQDSKSINSLYLKNLAEKDQLGDMSRRYLRGLIEDDLIKEQHNSLRKYQKIVNSVNIVKADVFKILEEARSLNSEVKSALDSTKSIKEKLDFFSKEHMMVNVKKDLLLAFKSAFTLNQYEEHILQYADISDYNSAIDFFNAINRVKQIQSNCDVLLAMENDNLGNKILSHMGELLISVKDKILYYIQNNIEAIYSNSNSTTPTNMKNINSDIFQRSFIYIWTNDKDGFDSVVSNLVTTRSRIVLNDFMHQLKNYSAEVNTNELVNNDLNRKGGGRLFLSFYDTNRFVSDTLAYVHNVLVNEMEGAKSLLTFEFTKEISISGEELNSIIGRIVQSIVSCLSKPIKGAIEHSIRQEGKISVLSNVSGVLDLYKAMYHKLLGNDYHLTIPIDEADDDYINVPKKSDNLIKTITTLEDEIQEKAFSLINLRNKNIRAEFAEIETDENNLLPDWLVEWCQFLDTLFQDKDSSGRQHIMGFSEVQWQQFLTILINGPLEIINDHVKSTKMENKEDALIWQINCIDYIISRISVISELNTKASELEQSFTGKVKALTEREFTKLLHNSGLFDIFNLVNMIFKFDDELFDVMYYQPITENKLFNLETFAKANIKLGEFLNGYLNNNSLTKLMSPAIYNEVFSGSSVKFVKFYGKLLTITREYLKDEAGQECKIFQWDEYSVGTLLGVGEFNTEN